MASSSGNRWDEVRRLFHHALDLAVEERVEFVASIADVDVRDEVERLLDTAERLDSEFLGTATISASAAMADHLMETRAGEQLTGSILRGRYLVERILGRGGQATVWAAIDLEAGHAQVAIKVLSVVDEHAQWLRKRFAAEWEVLSALRHDNVVAVRDFGEIDGLPFLVMEYVEGETLRERMARPLAQNTVAAIVRQLGAALGAAHQLGICHRDLKPENAIITGESGVKLIDFGIAQMERRETGATVTVLMMAGTARYMAPEQFLGISSSRSDVYSLGVMIYELLAGRCPYAADAAFDIARAQRHRPIRVILQETPEIPRRLAPLLAAALSLDPDQRQDNAVAFASDVAEIILEPKVSARQRTKRAAGWLWSSRLSRAVFAAMLACWTGWWAFSQWQLAHVVPVYETSNASDPLTDGFLPHNDVAGTVMYNAAGDALEAWLMSTGSQGHYHRPLTDAQKKVALDNGWSLTMIAKTLDGQAYADVDFVDRSAMFVMEAAVVNGKVLARGCIKLVPKYEFMDAEVDVDPSAFHEFRMTYDPVSKTAQIAVDGKVVITGYRGTRQYQDNLGVDFGCERFQSKTGKAAFKLIRFEINGRRPGGS